MYKIMNGCKEMDTFTQEQNNRIKCTNDLSKLKLSKTHITKDKKLKYINPKRTNTNKQHNKHHHNKHYDDSIESSCLVESTKIESSNESYCNNSNNSNNSSYESSTTHSNCLNRQFREHSDKLRCILGKLNNKTHPIILQTTDDVKYASYNYNGAFHKGFSHNNINGHLINSSDYTIMRNSILNNDQQTLASLSLDPNSSFKLVDPLSALSAVLVGQPQYLNTVDIPPTLSSPTSAAEMVELYAMALMRDLPFINYSTDLTIMPNILSYINTPNVLSNLKYKYPNTFNAQNIFRGISQSEQYGPYISQLLLLNIPYNYTTIPQHYIRLQSKNLAVGRVEWGINYNETIDLQNGNLNTLPTVNNTDISTGYIYSGRSLAECVHSDPPFQLYVNAALILNALGARPNPGFPTYPNQTPFITSCGMPNVQCALAIVTAEALRSSFYWKWSVYRKLRPEVFGLWIDNILAGRVANLNNYDIDNVVLTNPVLSDIATNNSGSYTLPLSYREGSPLHPSYPAGHAAIAGACCTVLKIFFDAEKPWGSLLGVQTASLSGGITNPVIANATGSNLTQYVNVDAAAMTIEGEINKLGSNIGFGRDWAGVHYRSDIIEGIRLGEQVAISVMEDCLSSMVQNNLDNSIPKITFRKFDNTFCTIKPKICKK